VRFYDIQISGKDGAPRLRGDGTPYRWTSLLPDQDQISNPGANQIEFDIPLSYASAQSAGATIRIWGISIQDISQASDLNNALIKVYGGMKKGLPLANPAQSGLILSGQINQAFGNWIGTEMTLDLVVIPDGNAGPDATQAAAAVPLNLPFLWKQGTALSDAILNTLATGFPDGYTIDVNIDPRLILPSEETGHYQSLGDFAAYIETMSKEIIGGDYDGVKITLVDKTFTVYDASAAAAAEVKQIEFNDFIGQPTWIGYLEIQFQCVMRADIEVGSYVLMPPTPLLTTTAQSVPRYRDKSAFQGKFLITVIHHIGNFRQPDGQAWVSVFNAVAIPPVVT
jgi:hypothetical protein